MRRGCCGCGPTRTSSETVLCDDECNSLEAGPDGCLAAPPEHTSVTASVPVSGLIMASRADVEAAPSTEWFDVEVDEAALVVTNPSECRPMAFHVTATGKARIAVDPANTLTSSANEAGTHIRLNGGDWIPSSVAMVNSMEETPASHQGWAGETGHAEIVIPPGGTLVIDRRAAFWWEQALIVADTPDSLWWTLPSIVVHGTTI